MCCGKIRYDFPRKGVIGVFLKYLDVAEAVLPFYGWDLIDYHTSHAGSFRAENYELLFRKHFPRLAHVPHDSQVKASAGNGRWPAARPTRHLRAWSAALLRAVSGNRHETGIALRKLMVRLPEGLICATAAR